VTRTILPAAVLAAVAVASGAGCGSSADAAPVATTQVTMVKSYRFDPETIEVKAGSTVTWSNDDNFTHTVHVDGREDHKVEPGDRVSISFVQPGTYHYVCTLHSRDMQGEVIVK
jgi:plastocyanin